MDDSTCDILGLFNRSIFYFSPTAASGRDTALDLSQKNKTNARLTAAVNKCSPIQVLFKIYQYFFNCNKLIIDYYNILLTLCYPGCN